MSFKGGAVDFKDGVVVTNVIQEILTDEDTSIKLLTQNLVTPAYLFTITFNNDKFSKYFKKLPGSNIPSVLLLKLMAYEILSYSSNALPIIDNNEFTNESKQHIHINNSDKIFPICPSFIYNEDITLNVGNYTPIGNSINNLLSKFNLYSKITQDIVKKLKRLLMEEKLTIGDKTRTPDVLIDLVRQHIIIMEYYSCITLKKFIGDKHYDDILSNYYIYGIALPPMDLEEFSCVLTFFMTLLMLESGFIHGDMHENNILLCVDNKQNIDPVVIDFGRTSRLNFENKFDTEHLAILMKTIEIVEDKKLKKEKLEDLKFPRYLLNPYLLNPYFREIYNKTIKIIPSNKSINIRAPEITQPPLRVKLVLDAGIAKHIENLLHTELYVEAAIVSSMCCMPYFNYSILYFFINSHLRRELSSYRSMYYCKSENEDTQLLIWKSYDVLLKRLLEARYLKRQSLIEAEQPKSRKQVTQALTNTLVKAFDMLTRSGRPRMGGRSKSKRIKRIKRTKITKRQK
jgi:hypothetical protein